ncbi:tyrosine-type recombinase/integrase [Paenibacillus sp. 2TAB26]
MIELENDFKKWLISEGFVTETIRNFVSQFCEFCRFCDSRGYSVLELSVSVSREYLAWLCERPNYHNGQPLSTGTRLKHYYCLRQIGLFLAEKNLYNGDLVKGIRKPPKKQSVIQGFSAEQLQANINAVREIRTTPQYKERMALLIFMLASTGLRISEATNLHVYSLDHNKRIMLVLGKGNKEREVPFSRELSTLILNYINKYGIKRDDYLFASRYKKP